MANAGKSTNATATGLKRCVLCAGWSVSTKLAGRQQQYKTVYSGLGFRIAHCCQHFGSVPFGRHFVPDLPDFSIFPDPERRPHDSEECFPKKRFHPPGTERFDHVELGVGEKRKIQSVFAFEFCLRVDGISAATDHGRIQLLETAQRVAKLGRFVRSTGRVGFGEKIED